MRVLNFGSLNLDYVYQVGHFVQPGETLSAVSQTVNPGGKGLNQSIALAKAGAEVCHAGCIGTDGENLRELLKEDTLVVTKLDRFARSVEQASDLITELIDKGVKVNVLNLGILSNDSVSTLMRNVLLSFAQ